jgi:CHAD domain-containing protein
MVLSMTETESKYDAPAEVTLPSLDGLPDVARSSDPQEHRLQAEYFDTEDLRLIRAGITLRRRTGGTDAGWHLKLPAGPQSRTEIRMPLGRQARAVPAELTDLVRARVRDQELRPVATVTTRRRTTTLFDAAGNSLAEVADDDVTGKRTGDPAGVSRWREVEVELTGGSRRLLTAADTVLRAEGLRPAGRTAKLEHVLGSELGPRGREPELSPSSPANQVVAAYLRQQAHALASLDPMVRRDRPDSIHQMRVATRRLRSTLRTFSEVIGGDDAAGVAAELRWLGGVLGEARDAEVQAARMGEQVRQTGTEQLLGPVQARIQSHFAKVQATARESVLAALNSERYFALLDALDAVITGSPGGPYAQSRADGVLSATVRKSYRKTRRRMRRALREPAGPGRDSALHQARKAAKQARYAAEAAEPVAGRDATRFARRMKKVQSVLGDHQDTVVGRNEARALAIAANQAGESSFSYGMFHEREVRDARRLQAKVRRVWRHAARRRYRRWMAASS